MSTNFELGGSSEPANVSIIFYSDLTITLVGKQFPAVFKHVIITVTASSSVILTFY